MKKEEKVFVFVLFLLLVALPITIAQTQDQSQQDYYNKLKNAGLTDAQATAIIEKYPVESQFLEAVRQAVDKNETNLLGIPIETLKPNFYKPGIITVWWKSSNFLADAYSKVDNFIKGVFGSTISDMIKSLLGVKKSLTGRLTDLIVGFFTYLLIAIGYLLAYRKKMKRAKMLGGILTIMGLVLIILVSLNLLGISKFNTGIKPLYIIIGGAVLLIFGIILIVKNPGASSYGQESKLWLYKLVGGKHWIIKAFAFTLIYFGVFQFPIINRMLEIVTFYYFTPTWIRPIISAIIIGFLPDIVQRLAKFREKEKEAEVETRAKVAAEILNDLSKY